MEERFWDYLYHLFNIYTIYINSLLFGVSPEAEVTRYIFPLKHPLRHVTNTLSGLKLCSQIKDFGTKTHFFSKKKREKVRFRAILRKLLYLFHISQIRKALNIGGVASEAYIWFDKADKTKNQRGAQIDLIIERADRVINLCEMKFSQAQYKISADYEIKLRNRMELFRDRTHCTKSLVNTFVTTFGVANGIHSSIVNSEVTLDNLFQE